MLIPANIPASFCHEEGSERNPSKQRDVAEQPPNNQHKHKSWSSCTSEEIILQIRWFTHILQYGLGNKQCKTYIIIFLDLFLTSSSTSCDGFLSPSHSKY